MTTKLVSIIIPAFNADRFMKETLQGVSNQDYRDWELIVVEDGSTSSSEELLRLFSKKNPDHRIEYKFNVSNEGQAAARNTGIRLARGSYIALLDADDIWLPQYLSLSIRALNESNSDIVFSTVLLFEDISKEHLGFWGPSKEELKSFQASMATRNFITPSATVFQREVFEKLGLFDPDAGIQGTEDYDLFLRALTLDFKFSFLDRVLCNYRKNHPTAATSKMPVIRKRSCIVLERHIGKLKDIDDMTKKKLLANRFIQAGIENITSDVLYSRHAFGRARNLDRKNKKTLLASLISYLPSKIRLPLLGRLK